MLTMQLTAPIGNHVSFLWFSDLVIHSFADFDVDSNICRSLKCTKLSSKGSCRTWVSKNYKNTFWKAAILKCSNHCIVRNNDIPCILSYLKLFAKFNWNLNQILATSVLTKKKEKKKNEDFKVSLNQFMWDVKKYTDKK